MALQVIVFFFSIAIGLLASGYMLGKNFTGKPVKLFSNAMMIMSAAFATWGVALILNPEQSVLQMIITIGLFVFSTAQIVNIYIVAYDEESRFKYGYLAYGIGMMLLILVLRIFFPSNPEISSDGMIFFNPNQFVNFLEIIFISSTQIPANLIVWRDLQKQNKTTADVFAGTVFAAILGGLMLITITKTELLTYVGWAMGLGIIAMLVATSGMLKKSK